MGFGIVERLQRDRGDAALSGVAFGVASGLAADEEGDLRQLLLRVLGPGGSRPRRRRPGRRRLRWAPRRAAARWRSQRRPPRRWVRAVPRAAPGAGCRERRGRERSLAWAGACTWPAPRCEAPAPSWNSKSSRNIVSRCSSRPIISGWTQVSNSTLAPSKPICGECRAGKSCTCTGAEITAQGTPRRLAMWRSICVPSTSSGCSSATLASTSR